MTVVLGVTGVMYNLAILAPAVLFGVVTYVLWMHASGRLAEQLYRRVQQRARTGADRSSRRGPTGRATRREPRHERRRRHGRATPRGGRQTSADTQSQPETASLSRAEARAVLGVEPGASQSQIRDAYRDRAKAVHPDVEDGDREAFKRIRDAYERLRE